MPGSVHGFPGKTQLPKSKKSDDVIALRCTCIQAAVLYRENYLQQFMLGYLPSKNSDYLMTYIDIHVYTSMSIYICT